MTYDFSGYATRNNIKCSDGRTIMQNAFADDNGTIVPLVYMHDHAGIDNVLGHVKLENRDDGVYCYGSFNNSPQGQNAKELVKHGDIKGLSIYANHLTQQGGNVLHGSIREVSLVLAGANPGAFIDNVTIQHGDEMFPLDDEAVIRFTDDDTSIELAHADKKEDTKDAESSVSSSPSNSTNSSNSNEKEDKVANDEGGSGKTIQEIWNTFTDQEKNVVYALIGAVMNGGADASAAHADIDDQNEGESSDGPTVQDIFDAMSDEKKQVVYAMVGMAAEQTGQSDNENDTEEDTEEDTYDEASHSEAEGDYIMHNNIFESQDNETQTLSHADQEEFLNQARQVGSFRDYNEAALAHSQSYGISNIDTLFPDAKAVDSGEPYIYKRDTEWVQTVLSSTRHTPFAKIKTTYADLTPDEARAKGYTLDRNNNNRKLDEVFSVYKRETVPQTIYKKQRLDRDDEIDITDFSVVNFLWKEMRIMLNEEIARDILIGDGRNVSSPEHVNTERIRPIVSDDDLYVIKKTVANDADATGIVDEIRTAKTGYQGSGNPTAFISPSLHATLMVQRDKMGRRLYDTDASLAAAMGVSAIVEVPVLESFKTGTEKKNTLLAIIGNLRDYTVGTNKGGDISSFEDFDIDFNQHKYLLETRLSGAITIPKSFIMVDQAPKA